MSLTGLGMAEFAMMMRTYKGETRRPTSAGSVRPSKVSRRLGLDKAIPKALRPNPIVS